MSRFDLWSGEDDELLVITREQLRSLATRYALRGDRSFEAERYDDYARDDNDSLCDVCAREYQRMRRLHDVTAGHLVKARAELADLRLDNALMERALHRWRGLDSLVSDVPAHYAGDGLVTCARAMESASAQLSVRERTEDEGWWWRCAFKYLWRMWGKESPRGDAEKAIDCLIRILELLGGESDER